MLSDRKRKYLILLFLAFAGLVALLLKFFLGGMNFLEWGGFALFALSGSVLTYYLLKKAKMDHEKFVERNPKPKEEEEPKKKKKEGEEKSEKKEE